MPIVVRVAQESDGQRVWQLLRQFATSYPPDETAFVETFPSLLGRVETVFLVAEADGFVHGYLLAFEIPTLFANGSILEIIELVVDEARRGEGLGSRLVNEALQIAWTCRCTEAVVPTRRAAPFYERLGFKKTADYLKLSKN